MKSCAAIMFRDLLDPTYEQWKPFVLAEIQDILRGPPATVVGLQGVSILGCSDTLAARRGTDKTAWGVLPLALTAAQTLGRHRLASSLPTTWATVLAEPLWLNALLAFPESPWGESREARALASAGIMTIGHLFERLARPAPEIPEIAIPLAYRLQRLFRCRLAAQAIRVPAPLTVASPTAGPAQDHTQLHYRTLLSSGRAPASPPALILETRDPSSETGTILICRTDGTLRRTATVTTAPRDAAPVAVVRVPPISRSQRRRLPDGRLVVAALAPAAPWVHAGLAFGPQDSRRPWLEYTVARGYPLLLAHDRPEGPDPLARLSGGNEGPAQPRWALVWTRGLRQTYLTGPERQTWHRALHDRLPTLYRAYRWLPVSSQRCLLCGAEQETSDHCLVDCYAAKQFWSEFIAAWNASWGSRLHLDSRHILTGYSAYPSGSRSSSGRVQRALLATCIGIGIHAIWRLRSSYVSRVIQHSEAGDEAGPPPVPPTAEVILRFFLAVLWTRVTDSCFLAASQRVSLHPRNLPTPSLAEDSNSDSDPDLAPPPDRQARTSARPPAAFWGAGGVIALFDPDRTRLVPRLHPGPLLRALGFQPRDPQSRPNIDTDSD
eukprot:tig00021571_g22367.t1